VQLLRVEGGLAVRRDGKEAPYMATGSEVGGAAHATAGSIDGAPVASSPLLLSFSKQINKKLLTVILSSKR